MGLEDEINDIADATNISEIVGEILNDASPGAMVIVCATLIAALTQEIINNGSDEQVRDTLAGAIENYAQIIVMNVPEQYTDEALEKVSKIDNLFSFLLTQEKE